MTSTQLSQPTPAPVLVPRTRSFTQRIGGLTATQVHAARWRVTGANGAVRGYVEERPHGSRSVYAATRMSRTTTTFLTLEEFTDFAEAVRAFRYL